MGTTTNFALPYPALSDDPDVPGDIQALATAIDTALLAVKNPACAIGTRATNQSVPTGTFTDITLPTEEFDNAVMFTAGTAIITVPVTAVYDIEGSANWAANGTGTRSLIVQVDGAGVTAAGDERTPSASAATRQGFAIKKLLTAGQQVKMQGFQSSGGALNITEARLSVLRATA